MMIVIAILWLFFVAVSYMNRDVRIDQTRAERLANTLYDQIRSARNNMIIGKWVASGATSSLIIADERSVIVSATGITTSYAYGSAYTGVESRLSVPFFDNDPKYQISDISVSSGSITPGVSATLDMTGITMATIVYWANWDIIIAASKAWVVVSTPIRTLRIQTGYGNFSRYVTVDRVTGITEILVLAQTGSTSGNSMTSGLPCDLGGTPVAHGSSITAYLSSSVPYNLTCSSESRLCTNGVLAGNYTSLSCSITPGVSCTLPWWWTISHGVSTPAYSAPSVASPTTCASVSESRLCTNGVLGGSYTNQGCISSSCIIWSGIIGTCTID